MDFAARQLPPSRSTRWVALAAGVALLAPLAVLALPGCAGRSPAEAKSREVRLTTDGAIKFAPRFSPDGKWIAFGMRVAGTKADYAVHVVAREGGAPRRISPDTLAVSPLAWSKDGTGLFCRNGEGDHLYWIGLDGSVRHVRERAPLTRIVAVSPDGETELALKFNLDNRDIGMRRSGGAFEFLAATPGWEEDATFGPGTDQVTVVSVPSYLAPTSTIAVWSAATRAIETLPLPEGTKVAPAWSADGRYLAYTAIRGGQADVYVYDSDTKITGPIGEDLDDEGQASWSPQGDWLVFSRSRKTSHLYSGAPGSPGRIQLTSGPARDYSPMVSPDGRWIAFFRRTPKGANGQDRPSLCVMPAGGGEVRTLDLRGLTLPERAADAIAWSRDSRSIAFNASDGSSKMDIYRIERDGTGLARVTVAPGEEVEPRWSPDGRWISFTQAGGGRLEVGVVPANGGLMRTVTPSGTKSEGSAWIPGTDRLTYVTLLEDGSFELWTTSIASPAKRERLIASKTLVWPLQWSDDGKELIVVKGRGNDWELAAFSPRTGVQTLVARGVPLHSGKGMHYELTAAGEKYRKLLYPGGLILNDGEDRGDLYLVPARSLLASRAMSGREQALTWNGRIVSAGYF